jgi:large conductance mechanosensitive channel
MLAGFRNFLMRGDVIVVAVGLVVALAFSNLVKALTDDIINPLIAAARHRDRGFCTGALMYDLGATHRSAGSF